MTRPWQSGRRSALGAVKRTGMKARGPSDVTFEYSTLTSTLHELSLDGLLYVGQQTVDDDVFTTYTCYTDNSPPACSAPAASETKAGSAIRTFSFNFPYRRDYGTIADHTVDGDDLGIYAHDDNTGAYRCYEYFQVTVPTYYGAYPTIPRDTADPILYIGCLVQAAAEADRKTSIPACGAGWSPSSPSGITYREVAQSTPWCYHILSRADENTAWSVLHLAGDFPSGADSYSYYWRINQTAGRIWCKVAANKLEVWPVGTLYSASSPTTITLPAGNVYAFGMWGARTFVTSTTGNVYVYNGTALEGIVPSPLNPATWDLIQYSFGWLAVVESDTAVHWFRITDDGVEWRQTMNGYYYEVYPVAPDVAIANTAIGAEPWSRLLYDHASQEWVFGGDIPLLNEYYADGWDFWDAVHLHAVFYRTAGSYYNFDMLQVT